MSLVQPFQAIRIGFRSWLGPVKQNWPSIAYVLIGGRQGHIDIYMKSDLSNILVTSLHRSFPQFCNMPVAAPCDRSECETCISLPTAEELLPTMTVLWLEAPPSSSSLVDRKFDYAVVRRSYSCISQPSWYAVEILCEDGICDQ